MNEAHVSQPAQGAEAGDTSLATRLRPGVPTGQGQLTWFYWKDKVAGVGGGMSIWDYPGK